MSLIEMGTVSNVARGSQIRKRQTDVEFEFIPRAIYNDFYAELQLREEGFSGKVNWSRKRIKQRIETNPQDIPDSLNLQSKALISSKMNQSDAVVSLFYILQYF